jgi:PAS domain S-box-containing protein
MSPSASVPPEPVERADPSAELRRVLLDAGTLDQGGGRRVALLGAGLHAVGGTLLSLAAPALPGWQRVLGVAGVLLTSGLVVLATVSRDPRPQVRALCAAMGSGLALLFAYALASRMGVQAITLGLAPLLILITGLLVGRRAAVIMTLAGVAGAFALGWAEPWLAARRGEAPDGLSAARAAYHAFAMGAGLWGALSLAGFFAATLRHVRRTEQMYRQLVETSPDCITLTEAASGRYLMVNPSFERLTGYSAAESVGQRSVDLGIWPDGEDRRAFLAALAERGQVQAYPAEFRTRHGDRLTMQVSGARLELDGQPHLVLLTRDITAQEQERQESAAILENASVGIVLTRAGRLQRVNPAFERMLGWAEGSLAGQAIESIWPALAEPAAVADEISAILRREGRFEAEWPMSHRQGHVVWCQVRARALTPASGHDLTRGTIWIFEDITERRRAAAELAAARDAAEAANRAKSAFLANMSHEIRTPLHGLVGLAGLARAPGLDAVRRDEYLDRLLETAKHLGAVISDVLDLSKIEAGQMALELRPFRLDDVIDGLVALHAPLAAARGLRWTLERDAGLAPRWTGDELRLRQILGNLLGNAQKFTMRGGITLRVRAGTAGGLRFEVEDTGPGIAASARARLFQPFVQADDSITRRHGGTGLGLSICRQLATLMGGEVGLVERDGPGSLFWVELPLRPAQADAPGAGGPHGAGPRPLAGRHLLVAEDNPVNMLIAVAQLDQWGARVTQAQDGEEAVAAVLSRPPGHFDAVLMDLQMPRLDGRAATRRLRDGQPDSRLPVIALTAAALVSERDEGLAAGMDEFLTKPIEPERLLEALLRVMPARAAPALRPDAAATPGPAAGAADAGR